MLSIYGLCVVAHAAQILAGVDDTGASHLRAEPGCSELHPDWPVPELSEEDARRDAEFRTALDSSRLLDAVATTRGVLDPPRLHQLLDKKGLLSANAGDVLRHIPRAVDAFGWRLGFGSADRKADGAPASVFLRLDPEAHDDAQDLVEHCKAVDGMPGAVCVLGGSVPLSKAKPWLSTLLGACRFRQVFYEEVDVSMDGITALPAGLNAMFVGIAGESVVSNAARGARLDAKPRAVLAAANFLTHSKRGHLGAFLERTCWASPSEPLAPPEYWARLAASRFVFVPAERKPQNTKMYEALMVLTIPICERTVAFAQLREQGFPIVLVDDWSEVTPERLAQWYKDLAPQLVSFRTRLLTDRWYQSLLAPPTAAAAGALAEAAPTASEPEVRPAASGLGCAEPPHGLFVLGVPGAGATLATEVLEALGAQLGPVQGHTLTLPEVDRLNDAIYLEDHGRSSLPSWWTRGILPPWSMKKSTGNSETLVSQAENILTQLIAQEAHCGTWAIKSPSLVSTFPVWANAAQRLKLPFAVLMVTREPLSNAVSLQSAMQKANPRHQRDGLQAWELQNGLMLHQTEPYPRYHVHYTDLVSADARQGALSTLVRDMQSFGLHLNLPEGGYDELMDRVQIAPHTEFAAAPGTRMEDCPSKQDCKQWTLTQEQANLAGVLRTWGAMNRQEV